MPALKYKVELNESERTHLKEMASRGETSARKVKRALVLLKADEGMTDRDIASGLLTSASTVGRVRTRFVKEGLDSALNERPRPGTEAQVGWQTGSTSDSHRVQRRTRRTRGLDDPNCLPTRWWRWGLPRASPSRRCARYSKKRTQAVEEEGVVHPRGERLQQPVSQPPNQRRGGTEARGLGAGT